ncbi:tetratricopeptide repeat protein [Streptomyces aurantiacus]|uniref:serine/threonine protein kinase n=1 Tax=Streptomyces aurantiacus TaxID=47760 RepID=UPI0004228C85|nr:serine/threonine protein kinase [Streptomyces aurantiacus]
MEGDGAGARPNSTGQEPSWGDPPRAEGAASESSLPPLFVAGPPQRAARVVLPPESPDPTVLPEITLLDRAVSRGDDPDALDGLRLPPDRLLARQYRVVRPLGYGGMGEVYLALDTKVGGREVAIKILRPENAANAANGGREGAAPLPAPDSPEHPLARERQELVELNHDDIIRVFNYGHHPDVGDFLVLQYVDGPTLEEVRARARLRPEEFGGARFYEFVLAYGVRFLAGLAYLHAPERGKVYGDLKPSNVMHDGSTTKFIDVGSVRRAGAPGLTSADYRAPTVGPLGESTGADDLFSLGETLRHLCGLGDLDELADLSLLTGLDAPAPAAESPLARAARRMTVPLPPDALGLGLFSLARALRRATRPDRADRFATAREMDEQLRGVFRELRSLRLRAETFEPSPLFLQSAHALDGGLGVPPPLSRWASGVPGGGDGERREGRAVPYGAPEPADIAKELPVPRPDPDDAHHIELSRLGDDDPAALLQHTAEWRSSPEVHLLRCRLTMRTALRPGAQVPPRLDDAAAALVRAEEAIGPGAAPYDWRLAWHRGLLALAAADVPRARGHFDRVYAAIPGEYAPKLALGLCAERLGRWREALTFYEAVRVRNPSLGGAAFGAARARLTLGGPRALAHAVEALDAVAQHSRHRTAARVAAVRVCVDHARGGDDLAEVVRRLGRLFYAHGLTDEQARLRMRAAVWEAARALLTAGAVSAARLREIARGADVRLRLPATERQLRVDLSRFCLGLAQQAARDPAEASGQMAEHLLDRAYATRPFGWRHQRGER